MTRVRPWDVAGYVSSLALVSGFGLVLWGLQYGEAVPLYAGIAVLSPGAVGMVIIFRAWAAWHRAHGSWWCCVWRWRGRRVHHFHWPKEQIVSCTNSAGFAWRRAR